MGYYGSRRSYEDRRIFENPISSLTNSEAYSIAYYMFEISKNAVNQRPRESEEIAGLIYQLSKSLGIAGRMYEVLDSCVDILVKQGKLNVRIEEEDSGDSEENTSRVRRRSYIRRMESYFFEEDEEISNIYEFDNASNNIRNFYRILFSLPEDGLTQILYYTFFSKAKVDISKEHKTVSERFRKNALDTSRVAFLQKELTLTDNETGYLLIRSRKAVVTLFDDVCNGILRASKDLYKIVLGISNAEFNNIIRPDGKLRQFGFINSDRVLNPALLECIEAQDLSVYFADLIKPIDLSNTYATNSFCVPENNTDIYAKLIKSDNPISVLLYGKPGSGKTEYAKALVKKAGKKALIFKNEAEVLGKSDALGRLSCLLSLNRKDTVLIIDEADALLATSMMTMFGPVSSAKSKGVVNKMLETSQNKVIWIVNYKSQIDESTLRRFTVSYKFEAMSPFMLESIAEKKLNTLDVTKETRKDILQMFDHYKVTGASVDNIIKTISSMNTDNEDVLKQNVEIVIKDNSTLLYGKSKIRDKVGEAYDLSVLNTSVPSEKLVKMLKNAKNYADKNPGSGAIRMLFYGLSGTGKTEFARYISQVLGKKVLMKRCSDILDKYVGGTEERIAAAFDEAASNDMILLWDEADSFFSDRSKARENYQRTQTNEFLTQLEEFPGIVICTTNLRQIMDPAMLRRFHFTVEFKALKENGIETLLDKYFPEFSFNEESVEKLAGYKSVTPGDFGRLSGSLRFMDPDEITADYIVEELCNIQTEKKNGGNNTCGPIGFCA